MAKDPAVLFYTSDFLTGTMMLSDEQVGKYIKLLCLQHQKGSLTEKDMLKICGSYDEEIFSKFEKSGGTFFNKRMRDEAEKRVNYSKSRAKNRKKKEIKEDMNNISNTYVEHMENENENINEDIIENKKEKDFEILEIQEEAQLWPTFEDFWNEYDKKVGEKGKIKSKWNKLKQEEKEKIMGYIPDYKLSQPDKTYRKNPDTFFNNKSWNDELIFKDESKQQNTGNTKAAKWANYVAKRTGAGN